ncbi:MULTISPECIES: ABC transporter ATP-binding protein [unclassified Pedobacter]|uniref:ABC transporter ATP-binding protein n=1 Tax=unclassified Pedobacter TaxID=2628915 RepID=UPI00141E4CC7|nr:MULTISPECIES: ABC transporter ATP-binding protein [unclassified Pedobacter]NII82847.1 ABC-2 type transport system ATP-binding protein [Pedobacter sp. SG908]NMN36865.1 ABC-2 type transport system ATP-binding protein [Pedobacter sp. SG918]
MLEAIGLTKKYQDHVALNNLNLKVEAGEVFCLLGQNGAGKTTTINLFLGFTAASSGEARINDILVSPNNEQTKQFLAYIPEVVMLYGHLSSIENLDFFSRIAGYTYKINELEAFLLQAGLQPDAFHKRLGNYSKGMRQKVGIAIAVAKNAKVILMDEPTSGLDPKATNEFSEIVRQLSQDGRSVFMATHDLFNAVNVGSRIGIMRQGTLVYTLDAKDISAVDLQKLYLETI